VSDKSKVMTQKVTVWHMLIACWIPKATNTHIQTKYVILTGFLPQLWLHEWTPGLCYRVLLVLLNFRAGGTDGYH